ncbi:MAG: response regulator [Deltaproteobacteria bacterium]|mgnify:FL=1|jgi:DNA-binding response OmpR family regulator|nr:response regulator [Deltaproteobacteria bacterium]MBT4268700.1 response regulator [Deltaproteobacteria bacterium]MBT4638894.1 response regulator [Deltaproteobacteria bacterium]MBT6504791.1 response regulator [Deltaproteobacteria bacterium]MBT7152724.1 response regulator [Deltaproteobacteria bacterium]
MARILLIDDDVSFQKMLKTALVKAGHVVMTASDGQQGYELFIQQPCELIITDIFMPEKEGIHTIFDFRSEFPEVKIIAISGGGVMAKDIDEDILLLIKKDMKSPEVLELAKDFGADEVMSKPIVISKFLHLVDETISGSTT